VRIWIDECLSPSLTVTARDRGYESTCNLHREMLGATDAELFATAPREDWTFATNNAGDFTELAAKADPHAGAIIVPQRLAATSRESSKPSWTTSRSNRTTSATLPTTGLSTRCRDERRRADRLAPAAEMITPARA
jgi:hypothetical protein